MEVIDWILLEDNLRQAVETVKRNKGASGIDQMSVEALDEYFRENGQAIKEQIRHRKYQPQPVRRVYIPKANGKKRPLGIPTVVDRVIQQAVAQVLSRGYDRHFSEFSYGFRPNRSAHQAIAQVLEYLNDGYTWVIDLDIEKYFDTVNHDKLISIIRERMNDADTLHLIRKFLRAGVMEDGLISPSTEGVPQGGPLSPILSNIYLDKLDKELEKRGLRFARYADDCNIYVKSEMAANRVMKSIVKWLEKNLHLKVNATKSKVTRPKGSTFLGFTFWKNQEGWQCKPAKDRKQRLYDKTKVILCRKRAVARPLGETFQRLNWLMRGWINYYGIGSIKTFLKEYGAWMRHKVRVVILKQWKRPRTIYRNLQTLNRMFRCNFSDEEIFKVANSRLGWYRRSGGYVVNYAISPKTLTLQTKSRPGLVDPLEYFLAKFD